MRHRASTGGAAAASRHAAGRLHRRRGGAFAAAALAVALIASPFLPVSSAQAVTHTFELNSADVTANAKDANPGDGICATAAGTCTMRAALEESNALNLAPGAILITPAAGFTGNIDPVPLSGYQYMEAASPSSRDGGSHFAVTAPVTIDMKSQVTIEASRDTGGALFHANGPDINFLNMNQALSGETSFVMGPKALRVTIDGGSSVTQAHYGPERFVVYREGAKDITVKNYRLQGFYAGDALFWVNAQSATPIENIVIDNVRVTYTVGGSCSSSDGSGCRTDILGFSGRGAGVIVDGFTFTNSFVSNLLAQSAFPFATGNTAGTSAKVSDITITDNEFINVRGTGSGSTNAFITLPYGQIAGKNEISGNQFVRDTSGQTMAVAWNGNTTSGNAGDMRIANNYFNGYSANSIYLYDTGTVNVEKNTFGERSASQNRPGTAEEGRDGSNALLDNNRNANGRVMTWYPTGDSAVLTGDAPAGSIQVESPLAADVPACVATLDVSAPSDLPLPESTVDLDLYWTADRTAEVYLGRVEGITGSSAKLLLDLPVGPQKFPSTVVGEFDEATIVDANTGAGQGYVRMQTVGATTGQSSQYSRMVGFSGNCRPELTIDQSATQNDSTMARDLHYTVKSSLPLDPASVTAGVVDVTAAAVAETVDAGRLNPRSVSVKPISGTANREFTVIARVDDSAKVTAGIAAEKVTSTGGLTNRAAAESTDPDITFINPVQAKPGSFTLVTGEPTGKQYQLTIASGAPKPSSDLNFVATPDQAATDNSVELSNVNAVIAAGATSSGKIKVTAAEGDVPANTPVRFSHTVTSDDSNFDGLVVNDLLVKLFSTDPSVKITKRAFTDVGDASSPAQIMATGTEALAGARLTDGQAVCFVYEVSNISADDWATELTDIMVTDTDTRLGDGGLIGSVPSLAVGQSTLLSACGSLMPEDTTVGGSR